MPLIPSTMTLARIFGLRGKPATIAATLAAANCPVGGFDVKFTWHSDYHKKEQAIGTAKTDAKGIAKFAWTIPENQQDDNVIVTAAYTEPQIYIPENPYPKSVSANRRVEIGTTK